MVRVRRRRRASRGLLTTYLLGNLPPTVQFALESRTHGALTFILISALVGTGIISVNWEDGRPAVQFSEQQAREVGGQVAQRIRESRWLGTEQDEDEWLDEELLERYGADLASTEWAKSSFPPAIDRSSLRTEEVGNSPLGRFDRGGIEERQVFRYGGRGEIR